MPSSGAIARRALTRARYRAITTPGTPEHEALQEHRVRNGPSFAQIVMRLFVECFDYHTQAVLEYVQRHINDDYGYAVGWVGVLRRFKTRIRQLYAQRA